MSSPADERRPPPGGPTGMVPGRVMALDVGERRVGVAVSDPTGTAAQPLETVVRQAGGRDLRALVGLMRRWDVKEVVVGLPTRTDGREGPEARRVREFVRRLCEVAGIPAGRVAFVDERFTTQEAERLLISGGVSRRGRRRVLDHVAAAIILETYLARRRVREGQGSETLA